MKIDKAGLELIKGFEGFRGKPYKDSVGVPTIGYGLTHYPGGRKVTMEDHDISEQTATWLLEQEVNDHYSPAVDTYLQVPVTQNQFDALVSFSYNLGTNALRKSTLLHKINEKASKKEIVKQFMRWTFAGGHPLAGLVKRRMAEDKLYFS